jgi:hypothetical protein
LLAPDWSGMGPMDEPRALLDQAPVIEIAALAREQEQVNSGHGNGIA